MPSVRLIYILVLNTPSPTTMYLRYYGIHNPDYCKVTWPRVPLIFWIFIIYFVLGHQASSHNFLSVIFGILGILGIGICDRFFFRRKHFWSNFFDWKNIFSKIFFRDQKNRKFSYEKVNENENFEIPIFSSKKKFQNFNFSLTFSRIFFSKFVWSRKIFSRKICFQSIFFDQKCFDEKISITYFDPQNSQDSKNHT